MRAFRFFLLILAASPTFGLAAENLYIGKVEQILLLPEGSERCPSSCAVDSAVFCISNDCGCGEATVKVEETLVGPEKGTSIIAYRLGEWCQPEFPLSGKSILIWSNPPAQPRWSDLTEKGGEKIYDPVNFEGVESDLFPESAHTGGRIRLSELRRRVGL